MTIWDTINRFLATGVGALAAMRRLRIWTPFLLYALLQGALLVLLVLGVRPPLTDFLRATVGAVLPDQFFHYPQHLLLLPHAFYRMLIPFGALIESLLLAAATYMLMRHFAREAVPGAAAAVGAVKFAYGQFVFFWLLNLGLLLAYRWSYEELLGDLWIGYGRRRMLVDALRAMGSMLFNSLIAYSSVVILSRKTALPRSLLATLRAFARRPVSTFLYVAAGSLLVLPVHEAMRQASKWIGKFNPEVMLLLVVAGVVLGTAASFFVVAALTFWYLAHEQAA